MQDSDIVSRKYVAIMMCSYSLSTKVNSHDTLFPKIIVFLEHFRLSLVCISYCMRNIMYVCVTLCVCILYRGYKAYRLPRRVYQQFEIQWKHYINTIMHVEWGERIMANCNEISNYSNRTPFLNSHYQLFLVHCASSVVHQQMRVSQLKH